MISNIVKFIVSLIKSLLSAFTQIIWTMVAIMIFRNYAEELLMYNPGMFNKLLSVIFNGWMGLLVALTIFYLIVDLKEIGFPRNYANKKENPTHID